MGLFKHKLGAAFSAALSAALAGVAMLLAGCEPAVVHVPAAPQGPDQPVVMPRAVVTVYEALDLAHRQCGLHWAAAAGAIDPAGSAPVGPFQVGQRVPLEKLLDGVARSAGAEWRWKRQMALFNPPGDLAVVNIQRDIHAVVDSDPKVSRAAIEAIGRMEADTRNHPRPGRQCVAAVMLDDDDSPVVTALPQPTGSAAWRQAVIALGAMRVRSAEPAIRAAMLLDRNKISPAARADAAWALGQIGGRPASELSDRLEDPAEQIEVRTEAAWALASYENSEGFDLLRSASRLRDATSRMLAAEAMGWLECDAPVARLTAMVEDGSPQVAAAAADALGRIGSDAACESLGRLLLRESPATRCRAADGLGQTGQAIGRELLLVAVRDPEPAVRAAIADALGWLGGLSAGDALQALCHDPAAGVRATAIASLARIGGDEGRQLAEQWLRERGTPAELKIAAAVGLGLSRHPAELAALDKLLAGEPSDRLRAHILAARTRIGDTPVKQATTQPAKGQPADAPPTFDVPGPADEPIRWFATTQPAGGDHRPASADRPAARPSSPKSGPRQPGQPPVGRGDKATLSCGPVEAHHRPDGTTLLSWQAAKSDDLAGYVVLRLAAQDRPGSPAGWALRLNVVPTPLCAWIDRVPAPPDAAARYYVVPVAATGRWGKPTAAGSPTRDSPTRNSEPGTRK